MVDNTLLLVGITLLLVVLGVGIWLRITLKPSQELKEKLDLAAQVPLLQQRIEALQEEKNTLTHALDLEREENTQKEVRIAEAQKDILSLRQALETEQAARKQQQDVHEVNMEEKDTLSTENATLRAQMQAQEAKNRQLQSDFDKQSKRLELKLNEIMQHSLDSKIRKFDENAIKGLESLLKPFRENLDTFRQKVEMQQEHSIEKFAALSKEIETIGKIGLSIGKEAENLASALKGKKQTQGSWGEMILESVLEYSGLIKGTHYETQSSYRDSSGRIKRPDVIVKLPQERTIIIDSKVSLNDYNHFIHAETEETQNIAAKAIVAAFKNHIDALSAKDYTEYKLGTLQYIFMFIPIEGAFSVAVQHDTELYEYALKKNIAIVNPSTLTVSLRTIYLYWQSEQSSTLAIKLFEEAGRLYDKMHNFSKSFQKIGTQLQTVNKSYEDAHKKLTEGTGNVLGRVEKLRQLGARTKGRLKDTITFQSETLDFEELEVEVLEEENVSLAQNKQENDA